MTAIPNDPDAKLTRRATAEALTAAGYPVTLSTLATMATRGNGPPFMRFGRRPIYRWGDVLEWAIGRTSKPVHSTSELQAA